MTRCEHPSPHRVVAVFLDAHEADEAVDELQVAGVPPAAIDERPPLMPDAPSDEPTLTAPTVRMTQEMERGWISGALVGAVSGLVIGGFLAWVASLPWGATLLVATVAGSVVGFVLGGAFGSLMYGQGHPRPEEEAGDRIPRRPATTIGVSVEDRRMLSVARTILQRHHPVRVTVRH